MNIYIWAIVLLIALVYLYLFGRLKKAKSTLSREIELIERRMRSNDDYACEMVRKLDESIRNVSEGAQRDSFSNFKSIERIESAVDLLLSNNEYVSYLTVIDDKKESFKIKGKFYQKV